MINTIKDTIAIASTIVSVAFTLFPESVFSIIQWDCSLFNWISEKIPNTDINIIVNRIIFCVLAWSVIVLFYKIILHFRCNMTISKNDYKIKVQYGDILKQKNCKRVITFDECYTTNVGNGVGDIKPTSLCGQYLQLHEKIDIPRLISESNLKEKRSKSKYQRKERYESGSLIQNGDDLLMAFVPLDECGRGVFPSLKEYIDCLFLMWKELDKYYGQHDVCIPILGAGITRIGDGSGRYYSQQELLDIMIWSYKITPYKIKRPYQLNIICRKVDGFSLNNVDSK